MKKYKTINENKASMEIGYTSPIIPTQEQKQETIEEASKKFIDLWFLTGQGTTEVFIAGAEWQKHQSEKMFSEEGVLGFAKWVDVKYCQHRMDNNKYAMSEEDFTYGTTYTLEQIFQDWLTQHKKH